MEGVFSLRGWDGDQYRLQNVGEVHPRTGSEGSGLGVGASLGSGGEGDREWGREGFGPWDIVCVVITRLVISKEQPVKFTNIAINVRATRRTKRK